MSAPHNYPGNYDGYDVERLDRTGPREVTAGFVVGLLILSIWLFAILDKVTP